jgi:hypothetical protein
MDKENLVEIHNYYLAIMNDEIMSFVGKWVELKITMLSEISETEKDKYHMFSPICTT